MVELSGLNEELNISQSNDEILNQNLLMQLHVRQVHQELELHFRNNLSFNALLPIYYLKMGKKISFNHNFVISVVVKPFD